MSIPTDTEILELFPNDKACVEFLLSHGIFYDTLPCPACQKPMSRKEEKKVFRCLSHGCNKREISIRKHTFFFGSALDCLAIMRLARYWLAGVQRDSAIELTGHSPPTVTSFYRYFRQLVSSSLTEEHQMIGGQGIIVEIDETKLGKRKYNRGHRVEGVWVVCGIERTKEARIFCVAVENRNSETLTQIVQEHVRAGSEVYTDMWKGYSKIAGALNMLHSTVNHSRFFKDPITGVCTNKVEGLNNGLKMKIRARNRVKKGITEHLGEFIWRKQNKTRLWDAFIESLRDIHYE